MIKVETIDGKIAAYCGKATGADLICEASAVVVSVIGAAIKRCKSEKAKNELAKDVFVQITGMAATIVEKADDEEETIISKAIPVDSDTGRKLMELLGIVPDEAKPKDDETKDDIPKFLF